MNYIWKRKQYFKLISSDDKYTYEVDTAYMHPYGHLYLTIQGKNISIKLSYESIGNQFRLHLTPFDFTTMNFESIIMSAEDYFKCLILINAYTSYILSKELYDDILYLVKYIQSKKVDFNDPLY